jgi:hypothetical protein
MKKVASVSNYQQSLQSVGRLHTPSAAGGSALLSNLLSYTEIRRVTSPQNTVIMNYKSEWI